MLFLGSKATIAWQPQPHAGCGNVAFGDGGVQSLTTPQLQARTCTNTQVPMRLAMPQ